MWRNISIYLGNRQGDHLGVGNLDEFREMNDEVQRTKTRFKQHYLEYLVQISACSDAVALEQLIEHLTVDGQEVKETVKWGLEWTSMFPVWSADEQEWKLRHGNQKK